MTWFEFWLFVHVLSAIVWIGGGVAIQFFGMLTKRAADPAKTAFFIRNVSWVVMRVFLPAAVLVFISGVGLVETGFWDYGETFVRVGIVLWVAVSLVAFGFLGRAMSRAGTQLETEGPSPAAHAEGPQSRLDVASAARHPGCDRLRDDGQARNLIDGSHYEQGVA